MTVHESSLSACIHSVLASELGKRDKAMELYLRTARLDLDNYNNDTCDGLHITSMSGGWLAIVQGFAGMRLYNNALSFKPYCPEKWTGYSFTVQYRGRTIKVNVDREKTVVILLSGDSISIKLFDLDGVICSTDEYHYRAWKGLADELGIYFDEQINKSTKSPI